MKSTLRSLLLTATATLAFNACPALAAEDATAPAAVGAKTAEPVKDYTIIKVSGDEIKNSEVLESWKNLFPGGSAPDFNSFDENIRQNVLRGLVSERLIYNEAIKGGYDKNPEVRKRIAALEKQVIMQGFMEEKAKSLVTDDELKAAYAEKVAASKGQEEVKARHILVPTEEEAKKIYEQVKKGGDFDKLAKEKSSDKSSGTNGGALGWFTKDKMVPEFAEAAFKLKKGEVSEPVKSEFGWHIIKLDDRRPITVASFDDMKESLKGELANKVVQKYVEGLLKKSDIKYYTPDGKEKPFSTSMTPANKAKDKDKPADKAADKKPE